MGSHFQCLIHLLCMGRRCEVLADLHLTVVSTEVECELLIGQSSCPLCPLLMQDVCVREMCGVRAKVCGYESGYGSMDQKRVNCKHTSIP